jgi:hypothetical protein
MADKIKDSPIKKAIDNSTKKCVCDHNRYFHEKLEKKDQSRTSYGGMYLSECRKCKEEGKTCEMFKEKKTGLCEKIKGYFSRKK